ncbi:helix-turn-helix domain-containing protein [Mesorhizobium sp. M7A.F.Ca.US.006.01.1.1]|uniref:helix-turn-helix transcriptional regulator n=1 Tax=Mesorhizobium sp. M7A.F.Ca.US.006.01.1.1 TaxID=2496707 RepID=UPI0019D0BB4B|nr:helix-turn-helix domain-containing protein [Mesorhizobium sp. M7A.F.Ca.US.006.01.1.1]
MERKINIRILSMSCNKFADVRYVCERLGIKERTLRRMCARGAFPQPNKIGRQLRWSEELVNRWTPDQAGNNTYVTHETRSGTVAVRLIKPSFQATIHGSIFAVFQTRDGAWHVRPFRTQIVWDAGDEPLELSCEDWEVPEIAFGDITQLSTRLANNDGDEK